MTIEMWGGSVMALPKEETYTYVDYLAWDENERIELLYGAPVLMAPPSRRHQEILTELTRQLANFLEGKKCRIYPAPFGVRLFEREGDGPEDVDTVVEPDLSLICDHSKLDDQGCKGAPDMVIEILSPSTQRHDRLTKLNLYQRAGVREYWIVNPEDKTVQVMLLEEGVYRVADVRTAQDIIKVNSLEGCYLELEKVFR